MARQPLRPAQKEYNSIDENLFREQITNFINEISTKVDEVEKVNTTTSAKSVRRMQLLLLGAPKWTS
jgi:CRISPR/Cas system-associated protein Csx1|tara:strand:+ start:695 stop:895 length:201 start_codon:yes stop_codon:yes gene_type:complete